MHCCTALSSTDACSLQEGDPAGSDAAGLCAEAVEALDAAAAAAVPLPAALAAAVRHRMTAFAATWGLSEHEYGDALVEREEAAGTLAAMWRRLYATFCVSKLPSMGALPRARCRVLLVGPGLGLKARPRAASTISARPWACCGQPALLQRFAPTSLLHAFVLRRKRLHWARF